MPVIGFLRSTSLIASAHLVAAFREGGDVSACWAGGGRALSLAPTHRPKMSNLRSTARRMAGWQVSWARTAALGGMKPAARVSYSLLAGSGFPACPDESCTHLAG